MTLRSFVISLILLVLLTLAMARNGNTALTGATSFPSLVVFLVIVFSAVVNPILRRLRPRWVLRQGEIVVVWCMLASGLTVASCGVLRYLLPFMVAPFYYGTEGGTWDRAFFEHIPDWLVPSKDPQSPIVTMFFESAGDKPAPIGAWVVPFFGWGVMLMAAFLVMFCMTAIIRKQWVEYERLSFPLARIPLEISRPPEQGHFFNTLFRSRWMWMGAAFPICFWGMHIMNSFFPWFPYINNRSVCGPLWAIRGSHGYHVDFYFIAIGVMFLLPRDVSLSLWLFFWLGQLQRNIRIRLGYVGGEFDMQQQAGGYMAFAAIALWVMRHHLKDVFRKALLGAKDVDDSEEGLSYRFAVFGWLAGVLVIIGWLVHIGCGPFSALCIVVVSCAAFLVLARFVAQCGLFHISFRPEPMLIVQDLVGDANIGPKGLTGMTFYQLGLFADQREVLAPALLNNAKMAERKVSLRKLFAAMMLSVVICYGIGYFTQVREYYRVGAPSQNSYSCHSIPTGYLNRLETAVNSGKGMLNIGASGVRQMLAGAGAFAAVHFLRSRFYWWPVHPVGLLTIRTWPLMTLWVSIFIGWLCKTLAQKYVRGPAMAKVRCFFLGFIVGDIIIGMVCFIIGLIAQKSIGWSMS